CIFSNGGYLVKPTLLLDPKIKNAAVCHPAASVEARGEGWKLDSGLSAIATHGRRLESMNCSAPKTKLYNDKVLSQMREILLGIGELHPVRGCTVFGKT